MKLNDRFGFKQGFWQPGYTPCFRISKTAFCVSAFKASIGEAREHAQRFVRRSGLQPVQEALEIVVGIQIQLFA
jgi:hypothetical protein